MQKKNAMMKARSFAEVGNGALFQERTYIVTKKLDTRCRVFSSLAVSLKWMASHHKKIKMATSHMRSVM